MKSVGERISPGSAATRRWRWSGRITLPRGGGGRGQGPVLGVPAGSTWDLFWVGPAPDRSRLAKMLQDAFPARDDKPRFHPLEDPAKRLSGSLSGLLRSAP
ncbi:MAG: hypothetical protein U0800_06865 [Isosphaeraceae bacterium]